MKNLIAIILIFTAVNVSAKSTISRIQILESKLEILLHENDSLGKQIREFKNISENNTKLLETQLAIIGNSNDNISNQISSMSSYISIAGLILGFFGLFIGGYVTWMQNRSANILKKSKDVLNEIKESKTEVEETQELISNNIKGLYSKIQEQEVEYILKRLEKIPEDIQHVFPILASMEISDRFFDRIKPMILNESKKQNGDLNFVDDLLSLTCQHFPALIVKDVELLGLLLDNEDNLFKDFYDIELKELLIVFTQQIHVSGLYNSLSNIEKILGFISPLTSITMFIVTIFNSLDSKLNRFEFCRIIKDLPNIENIKTEYYRLLCDNYLNDNNSENDNLLLNEINKACQQ